MREYKIMITYADSAFTQSASTLADAKRMLGQIIAEDPQWIYAELRLENMLLGHAVNLTPKGHGEMMSIVEPVL